MHFVGGLVGSLLIGFFANPDFFEADFMEGIFYGGGCQLLGEQALANGAAIVWSLRRHLRASCWRSRRRSASGSSDEEEETGLDLAEHAETAYHGASST